MAEKTFMNSSGQVLLDRYLKMGRIHPCILLVGPDKAAKLSAAVRMAKSIFCSDKSTGLFCGKCSSCQRIEKEIYPDLLLFKEDNEEALKVENVRDIIYQMEVAPLEGRGKVCIIEEAHRMNSASSNAFLKTLEEPKENRFFILTTTKLGGLLPTLVSRSLLFHFKPESETVQFSGEEWTALEKLLGDFQSTQEVDPVVDFCEEKESALRLLQFLQVALRKQALGESQGGLFAPLSPLECTYKYQKTVELEGKLRSNANTGLLVESLMRQEFLK
jgi:hypothetical protein